MTSDPENYRLVKLHSALGKLSEGLTKDRVVKHTDELVIERICTASVNNSFELTRLLQLFESCQQVQDNGNLADIIGFFLKKHLVTSRNKDFLSKTSFQYGIREQNEALPRSKKTGIAPEAIFYMACI